MIHFIDGVNNVILRNVVKKIKPQEKYYNIKILKLQSTLFALKSLCKTLENIHVLCHVDNGSAITEINKMSSWALAQICSAHHDI